MRNLLQFIYRYHAFFLFLFLEIFSVALIYRNNHYQQTGFINSTNTISSGIYNRYNTFLSYLHLRSDNDRLQKENAYLRQFLPNSVYQNYVEVDTVEKIAPDSSKQMFAYISADVITVSVNRANNFITINRGKDHGIKKNMAVISDGGVVGMVKAVSDDFAAVVTLLHQNFQVSAKLKRQGNWGYVKWNGSDPSSAQLLNIPNSVKIEKGDEVITSGISLVFPEGVAIGKVNDYKLKPGSTFFEIDVDLATDFRKLNHVYVVESLMKTEIDSLENLLIEP